MRKWPYKIVPQDTLEVGETYVFIRENVHLRGELLKITDSSYIVDDDLLGRTTIFKSSVIRTIIEELQDNEKAETA